MTGLGQGEAGCVSLGSVAKPVTGTGGKTSTVAFARQLWMRRQELSAADFERIRQLIYQRAGISLHAGKQAMVYSRLSRRLRETGHRSFGSYLQWLETHSGAAGEAEWQEFINCLTTNLTAFFREEHHFHAFADDLKVRGVSNPRIWCNAASTGEEPYSIAMTVAEVLGASTAARILASDIDTKVLATAQRGVYDADARGLSPELRPLQAIGYRQALAVIAGRMTPADARRDIVQATLRYAKRQRTWFRHQAAAQWHARSDEAARAARAFWGGAT